MAEDDRKDPLGRAPRVTAQAALARPLLSPARLRSVAEDQIDPVTAREAPAMSVEKALEELRIHQIELELQHDELQRVHAELICSHAQFRTLFDDGPLAYLETDDRWRILNVNKAAVALFGAELPGRSVLSVKVDGQLTHFLASLQFGDVGQTNELPLRRPSGTFYARIVARRLDNGFLLAIEDVSEIRRAHQALVASKTRLQRMLAASPDGIAVVRHNRVLYVNAALCRLLGASHESLLRRPFNANLTPGSQALSDAPRALIELHMQDSSGASHPVECHTVEIEYEGYIALLVTCRDLTERRRIEAKLAQSERLAGMGMLIAGVAHELNNPLTYIHANLDMLIEKMGDMAPELKQLAEDARSGTQRLANIVSDLRTFEVGDDDIAAVQVNNVVAEAIRMALPKTDGILRITRDLGRLPDIQGAGERLGQVVLNLILNASMAMPPARDPAENRVWIRTYATASEICIAVQDNGVGIEAEDLRQLFDPFFTTRKEQGGTGLGLTISNSLIQRMGGYIDVQSEPGAGARFVVHLPRDEGPAVGAPAAQSPASVPPAAAPDGTLRILIVEDEAAIAMVLERVLCDLGTVDVLKSGQAAIERLRDGTHYDIVLSDLIMPDGNGEELAAWVEANRPELMPQFVLMSGMSHPEFASKRAVLRKPFNIDHVRKLVARLGTQARAEQKSQPATG